MNECSLSLEIQQTKPQYSVIVVDDEQNILQSLKRIFHNEPFTVLCANSGEEGLRLLAVTPFVAVIISDQRMPNMIGSEFLERSKIVAPDAIKMILTGHADIESTIAAINEGGATHFIVKPWDNSYLLQTVRDAVSQYHLIMENRRHLVTIKDQNEKLQELLSSLTEQNKTLERLASSDILTGLTNRRALFDCMDREMQRCQRYGGAVSLILFDIDHFKHVNDTWGHVVGDTVLKEVARRAKFSLRETDVCARYGGEEFVILMPETALQDAARIAERLRLIIAETPVSHDNDILVSVTISLGVAQLAMNETGEKLLNRADQAMYIAKNSGRNRLQIAAEFIP